MFSIERFLIKRLSSQTGFRIRVGASKANLFAGRFRLSDVTVTNPPSFPIGDFLSVEEAEAQIAAGSLLSGKIRASEVRLHVRSLTGVRADSGSVNIEQFREALERRDAAEPGNRHSSREIHIERLVIRVDHVTTVDFAEGGAPREYPVRFAREFSDVNDLISVGPPLVESCGAAGLCRLRDAIFGTLLPDILWRRIDDLLPAAGAP